MEYDVGQTGFADEFYVHTPEKIDEDEEIKDPDYEIKE